MAQTKPKQKKEIVILAALLVIAAVVWYGFVGKNHIGAARLFQFGTSGQIPPLDVQDYAGPMLQLEKTRSTEYKASGRNIFVAHAVPVDPVKGNASGTPVQPAPKPFEPVGPRLPPPPPPPQLGMKFFGYGATPVNSPRLAFLQDGDDIRIVREGDVIKDRIRITHIGNDSIEYQDITTGIKNKEQLELPPTTSTSASPTPAGPTP
jgi:hypothetical protein